MECSSQIEISVLPAWYTGQIAREVRRNESRDARCFGGSKQLGLSDDDDFLQARQSRHHARGSSDRFRQARCIVERDLTQLGVRSAQRRRRFGTCPDAYQRANRHAAFCQCRCDAATQLAGRAGESDDLVSHGFSLEVTLDRRKRDAPGIAAKRGRLVPIVERSRHGTF